MKKPPDSPAKSGTETRPPAFKNSELGPIPADWEVERFEDVFASLRNNTLSRACMSEVGTVFNIHYGDVLIRYGSILNCEKRVVPFVLPGWEKRAGKDLLKDGDLVVADTAEDDSVGKAVEMAGIGDRCAVSGLHTIACHPVREFASGWLGYFINSPVFHNQLLPLIVGIKVSSISKNSLKSTLVLCPPLPEQRRIAAALSDADAWIESLDKLIEKKKLVKQGTMQALLSGKTRLPGFSGEWGAEAIAEEFVFLRTNTLSRACLGECGRIADVHYGDVLVRYGSILDFSVETPPFIDEGYENRSIGDFLNDGDLVVADTAEDETVGKAVEIQNLGNRQAVAGLHTVACRPKHPFAPGWLGHFINSPSFHDQLLPLISGTKVSSISKENLKTVFVRRPPLAEQFAIVSVLSDMDAELASLSREKAKAEQIKQGMMQELLTGRVRLAGGE